MVVEPVTVSQWTTKLTDAAAVITGIKLIAKYGRPELYISRSMSLGEGQSLEAIHLHPGSMASISRFSTNQSHGHTQVGKFEWEGEF